jgi:hypothetical protein
MAQVVPIRRHLTDVANGVASKFCKIDHANEKANSIRVDIGFDLIELQERVAAGEARERGEPEDFWVWIKLRVNRSLQDMRKCIALAKAEDPEAAAAQEREDNREYQQKSRARKSASRADSQRPAEVVSFDPVERALDQINQILKALNEDERKQVVTKIKERYPC